MSSLVGQTESTYWELKNPELAITQKISHILTSMCRELSLEIKKCDDKEKKKKCVHRYYRKYYTLTLNKTYQSIGINRSPTRDIFLDYPWKDCEMNRVECLKIWEKINQ